MFLFWALTFPKAKRVELEGEENIPPAALEEVCGEQCVSELQSGKDID